MPVITRKKLSKGVKLTPQHIDSLSDSLATTLTPDVNGYGFGSENLSTKNSRFHMDWYIPTIRSSWGYKEQQHPIMFTLPPLQNEFDSNFTVKEISFSSVGVELVDTRCILDEIMISWDQAQNPVAITDTYGTRTPGLLADAADNYSFIIRLYEKTPQKINSSSNEPDRLVWNATFDGIAVSATGFRNNPFLISNINVPIHPYKTYIWTITFTEDNGLRPTIDSVVTNICLPNFHVKATFKTPLKSHDLLSTSSSLYQNFPEVDRFWPVLNTSASVTGSIITADTLSSGSSFNDRYGQYDRLAVNGYMGGLSMKSDFQPNQALRDDFAYDVIVVPLFTGADQIRKSAFIQGDVDKLSIMPFMPQLASGSNRDYIKTAMDRRIIRLDYPCVIHHVYCAVSFYAPQLSNNEIRISASTSMAGSEPGLYRGTIQRSVGVLLGSGIRGDNYDYQQVAYAEMNSPGINPYIVDRVQIQGVDGNPDSWGSIDSFGDRTTAYDAELWQVPLVGDTARSGFDYSITGYPVFAGQGNRRTKNRTQIYDYPYQYAPVPGSQTPHTPYTQASEQWIEVRGRIEDTAGFANITDPNDAEEIILGTTGWYVYIVVRRPLTNI